MAYDTNNPPALKSSGVGGVGKTFFYSSADTLADVNTAGYFSNGYDLGMRVGDKVEIYDTTTPARAEAYVNAASATSVDLTDGLAMTATDTD